jgi:chorismate synthase
VETGIGTREKYVDVINNYDFDYWFIDELGDDWAADGSFRTETNNCGGIQGGISNGMPIEFRVAFHPVVSIPQPVECLHEQGRLETVSIGGRHDRYHLQRATVVVEAMTALCLINYML